MSALVAHQQAFGDAAGYPDIIAEFEQRRLMAQSQSGFRNRYQLKLTANGDLVKVIGGLSRDAIDRLGGPEAVKGIVGGIYDTYIEPIDIPWVPNLIERTVVDPWFRSMALKAVDEIYTLGS